MIVTKQIHGSVTEIFLRGRVDGVAANQLEVEVSTAMRAGAGTILLNFAEADFLCSAGIRVLLQYHRLMKNQQKLFQVSRVSPEIDAILDLTGFREILLEKVAA
jgi:anti-sigma B factor antagonist